MANDSRQLPSLMNLDRVQNATLSLMPDASSKLIYKCFPVLLLFLSVLLNYVIMLYTVPDM